MRRTTIVVAAAAGAIALTAGVAAYASSGALPLGPASKAPITTYKGYYDGHKDVFVVTDVSVTEPTLETVFINLTGKDLRE